MSDLDRDVVTNDYLLDVIIIGAGFSGIAAGVRLKEAKINNFIIIEKSTEVGGVWRENTYPGCECDIPSSLYSYSFAPNPDWSHVFAKQKEIQQYIKDVTRRFKIDQNIVFNTELVKASWSNEQQIWLIETNTGRYKSKFVFFAAGPLSEPVTPVVKGLERFKGKIFHSAQWDHSIDLNKKRVAVIGTGASAIQIIPAIQPIVDKLYVFQRTAPWVIPKPNMIIGNVPKKVQHKVPFTMHSIRRLTSISMDMFSSSVNQPKTLEVLGKGLINWMHYQIKDPVLREKVTPKFTMGCKRILFSNTYYPALAAENVELIDQGVREITKNGILVDGKEIPLDIVVWSTGFEVAKPPIAKRIINKNGTLLDDVWLKNTVQAYKGCMIKDLPNAFMVLGPNSISYNSLISTAENQINYAVNAIEFVLNNKLNSFEIIHFADDQYNHKLRNKLNGTVFNQGGCSSYYLDENKVNVSIYPWTMQYMKNDLEEFDHSNYHFK
ncbi:NAD(P)/FAD-dependent oxidoreductase [Acinetobacter sp. NIPH 1852]|uniref:flavin-containing monooxygenase n=1 Tax=Acinetobacter sp. NIPH 1852 TaxID=2923428 RepID=UPI001F4A10E7|nr:NAD(P)/FAD-dependent oxidoreductase [Acinetobacter sp. NIPH 1852]MCH7308412.1 NAD(P)/FAD-dependent oxidoreductase [Acinetobacter sp. NIPH 1852]